MTGKTPGVWLKNVLFFEYTSIGQGVKLYFLSSLFFQFALLHLFIHSVMHRGVRLNPLTSRSETSGVPFNVINFYSQSKNQVFAKFLPRFCG